MQRTHRIRDLTGWWLKHSLSMTAERADRRQAMEQEMTVQELIALVNAWEGDFILQIELKEGDTDGKRKEISDGRSLQA